ncbi:MAG: hypothetical protein AAGH53_11085 [Pseudomonadota bacterium]
MMVAVATAVALATLGEPESAAAADDRAAAFNSIKTMGQKHIPELTWYLRCLSTLKKG